MPTNMPKVEIQSDGSIIVDGERYIRYSSVYNNIATGNYVRVLNEDCSDFNHNDIILIANIAGNRATCVVVYTEGASRVGACINSDVSMLNDAKNYVVITYQDYLNTLSE